MKQGLIYVDIESLMDLRQGHLSLTGTDPDLLSEYLLSESYNFRETDELKYSSLQGYRDDLSRSDLKLLEGSTITHILGCLISKLDGLEKRNKFYNETLIPEILLNVYPFKLTQHQADHLRDLLFYKLGKCVRVSVTYLEPAELSPLFFKNSNVISAFIYDFSTWLDTHTKTLEHTKIHDTLVYTPGLYRVKPTEEELRTFVKLGFKDPMSYTSYILSGVMVLNFLPVFFYSNLVTANYYLNKFKDLTPTLNEDQSDGDSSPKV